MSAVAFTKGQGEEGDIRYPWVIAELMELL